MPFPHSSLLRITFAGHFRTIPLRDTSELFLCWTSRYFSIPLLRSSEALRCRAAPMLIFSSLGRCHSPPCRTEAFQCPSHLCRSTSKPCQSTSKPCETIPPLFVSCHCYANASHCNTVATQFHSNALQCFALAALFRCSVEQVQCEADKDTASKKLVHSSSLPMMAFNNSSAASLPVLSFFFSSAISKAARSMNCGKCPVRDLTIPANYSMSSSPVPSISTDVVLPFAFA